MKPDLLAGLDDWLQQLVAFNPKERFLSASDALHSLLTIIVPVPASGKQGQATPPDRSNGHVSEPPSLTKLPKDYILAGRFVVQERLGQPGGFAVAYKVFDTLADLVRVVKLVTRDRNSVLERLRQEYKALLQIPDHPNVVKVIWADRLPDETPYIVFEYIDGLVVEELVRAKALAPQDALKIAYQTAEGLAHIHKHGIYHQDIKPSNLLWTDYGVRIIDFNVAVSERDRSAAAGGTRRYIPPDLDLSYPLTATQEKDRDTYALGITLYECLTGLYPFDSASPPLNKLPNDPRTVPGCEDLASELVQFIMKILAPSSTERFSSAEEVLQALRALPVIALTKPTAVADVQPSMPVPIDFQPTRPNYNPFVSHLLTLYSQSQHTNAGTRGLDNLGAVTYVPTLLDRNLKPAILAGEFNLVIISGNAGDGKTAFIQQLENSVASTVTFERQLNGAVFTYAGRTFRSNYDGSQDEGDKVNDAVLLEFFAAFEGSDDTKWPTHETRLIAINEGRLVDFLTTYNKRFPRLKEIVRGGLNGSAPTLGVAVINLNLRAVVADTETTNDFIFDRLIRRMTDQQFWSPCAACDLRDRCYIYHNARTFMDPIAGPKVIERTKFLHTVTHLRGRLHVTLRDLRSALAFMLAGTRDCDDVHSLYNSGTSHAVQDILGGFYFNSWLGGERGSSDRLISLLKEIDVGEADQS